MYRGIFDTHAHYDDEKFDFIRHAILSSLPELGVRYVVNCGSDEASSLFSAELAGQYDFLYASAGVHPHAAAGVKDGWEERIAGLLSLEKVVAVGEIGLDYHYHFSPAAEQRAVFAKMLSAAVRLDLPVIVHDRDAHEDVAAMLREYRPRGVVHRFSGDPAMAERMMELGLLLGFGGAVTYENAKNERDVLRMMPLSFLLLETDCPYLSPIQCRSEICRSDMIGYAADTVAALRPAYTAQQIVDAARENGVALFGLR